jgi:pimeloyl-ACP methyl ester carboxylesterase
MRRLVGTVALVLAGGCVPLTPYAEIRARLPAESLIEVDGRLAHVVRSGRGEPVVLLHGFGASAYSWRHVMAALASDYELIAMDLNGHGYTERARGAAAYTVAGQLDLVLGVMDALGVDTAHVAGHSYGGALATHLAWRHPRRVRSLVLVDSAGTDYPWERRHASAAITPLTWLFVRTRAIKREAVLAGLERSFADDSRITPELVDAYYERIRIEGVSRAFRGLTVPTSEPRQLPDLTRLDLPVLMVWGAEDELTRPSAAERVAAALPRARLELLDGVGHIPLEESPHRLTELMRVFLARHRPG